MNDFIHRIFRRAHREPALRWFAERAQDHWEAGDFYVRRARRREWAAKLDRCRSVEDFYELAGAVFDPHQLRPEITAFLAFAREQKPHRVCEIGVASGGTNFLLTHALPAVTFMLGIDLFVRHRRQLRSFARPGQRLCFLDGSSYAPPTVERAGKLLAGDPIDVLFIDGDHSYEGARADFLAYRRFVREDGLIVFHDIVPDYFTRHGQQTGRDAGGVPILWKQLREFYEHREFIEDPEQDGLGIGVLNYSSAIELPNHW